MDEYEIRIDPDGEVIRFRAHQADDVALGELIDLEIRLQVAHENWTTGQEMLAMLWYSAQQGGQLRAVADLLPAEERAIELDDEGAAWEAARRLRPRQVRIVRDAPTPDPAPEGADVPPDGARE
jgi:hypothetical protein